MLKGKRIVVGITGSIAAYKIPFLVRLLVKEGAEVRIIMTPAAKDFVTPLTLSTLSQHAVIVDSFKAENEKRKVKSIVKFEDVRKILDEA